MVSGIREPPTPLFQVETRTKGWGGEGYFEMEGFMIQVTKLVRNTSKYWMLLGESRYVTRGY